MKNNSKKTNKQNTARSAQNNTRRMSRRTKDERRNILFSKKHVKMETRRALYGTDHDAAYVLARGTDLNRRFVAAFLALVFAISCMVIGVNFATQAENSMSLLSSSDETDTNLVLDKTISAETDGTYTLKLSAFAKGTIKNTSRQIPTDYILVVDQSGSMSFADMPTAYEAVDTPSTGWTFDHFKVEDSTDDAPYYVRESEIKEGGSPDKYYRVYRKWGDLFEVVPRNTVYVKELLNTRGLSWGQGISEQEQSFNSQYYYQPKADKLIEKIDPAVKDDDTFYPLTILTSGESLRYETKFRYIDKNNNTRYMKFWYDPVEQGTDPTTSDAIFYYNSVSNASGSGRFGPGDRFIAGYNTINGAVIRVARDGYGILDTAAWILLGDHEDGLPAPGSAPNYTYAQFTGALNTGMYIQNKMFIRHVGYNSLAYRDSNGVEHTLVSTPYCDAYGTPKSDENGTIDYYAPTDGSGKTITDDGRAVMLYKSTGTLNTRVSATQAAITSFVENVAAQKDRDGETEIPVDHRIAIVGFSSNDRYDNNELLTNGGGYTATGTYGIQRSEAGNANYKNAFVMARDVDSNDGTVNPAVTAGINALSALGGTQPEIGLEMAYKILDQNKDSAGYNQTDANGNIIRNAVVVFFTDGRPGDYETDNQYNEANDVVSQAYSIKSLKNSQSQAISPTIYTVGMFGESDGNPLTFHQDLTTGWFNLPTTTVFLEQGRLLNDFEVANKEEWKNSTTLNPTRVSPSLNGYTDYLSGYASKTYYPDFYRENGTQDTESFTFDWDYALFSGYRKHWTGTGHTHRISGTYWRDYRRNTANFPRQADDTIADYMTVVSSTYPNATSFDNGWSTKSENAKNNDNYINHINAARGTAERDILYFSASDSASLNNIFVDIAKSSTVPGIATDADLFLRDVISDYFDVTNATATAKTYYGWQDDRGNYRFDYDNDVVTISANDIDFNKTTKTVDVSGFNYTENYIAYGKNDEAGDPVAHRGRKIVVEIKGLKPVSTATSNGKMPTTEQPDLTPDLPSNDKGDAQSGIYQIKTDTTTQQPTTELLDAFVSPTIERYAYKINVGQSDTAATFDIDYLLSPKSGVTSADHDEAILIRRGDATAAVRYDTLTNNNLSVTNLGNDNNNGVASTVYIEYITSHGEKEAANPEDFSLQAKVTPKTIQNDLEYYLGTGNDYLPVSEQNDGTKIPTTGKDVSPMSTTPSDVNAFWVNSKANTYTVTIKEKTEGPFSNTSDTFTPTIILTPNAATDATSIDLGNGIVAQKDGNVYKVTLNNPPIQGNEIASVDLSIPAGYTLAIEQSNSGTYYNRVTEATYTDDKQTSADTYTLNGQVIDSDTVITIKNFAPAPEPEGVNDSNHHNWIIYILAVLAGLAAIGAGIFLWKKRNEFVEE